GIGASLGLAVPMISTIASEVLNIPDSWILKLIIIFIWILLFGISVYRGLDKGIKIFSNINIVLAIGFAIFVFFIGPSRFILKVETNSIGLYLQNVIRMSFWTDPIGQGGFVERWTAFYWGWWLSYAPMMGLFIARISKGRTLKQVSVGMITWGALGSCFFFAIFGGYSLYLEKNNILNISQILNTLGSEMAIIEILKTMPFPNFITIVYGIICFIFLATTIDSSAYVLASICTKQLKGNEEPKRWNRLLWAFVFGLVAVSLVLLGGLESAQASAIIGGTPIIIIFVILVLSLKKMIREDYPNLFRKENYSLEEKNK
ncbi:BCCT family transporter, partial [Romboutsia sp.]|uniref:BCCT family transporter n=1 Tax=Romboutsia sp. TaxID=1965302 RepID=UPI002BF52F9E